MTENEEQVSRTETTQSNETTRMTEVVATPVTTDASQAKGSVEVDQDEVK